MKVIVQLIAWVYAVIRHLYPHYFRAEFGDEMQATFVQAMAERCLEIRKQLHRKPPTPNVRARTLFPLTGIWSAPIVAVSDDTFVTRGFSIVFAACNPVLMQMRSSPLSRGYFPNSNGPTIGASNGVKRLNPRAMKCPSYLTTRRDG